MTRKQLEDLGLTKEQVDSVMKINGDDIENAKGTASTEIKNLQTEVEGLKTQVGDRDKQLETLKASAGDNADLKKKIEDLQTENATAKATHESELNQLKIDFAVEKALTGAKAKLPNKTFASGRARNFSASSPKISFAFCASSSFVFAGMKFGNSSFVLPAKIWTSRCLLRATQ